MLTKTKTNWCIISPKKLDSLVEKAVSESGLYRSKSDLIRDAVRLRLKELEFLNGSKQP